MLCCSWSCFSSTLVFSLFRRIFWSCFSCFSLCSVRIFLCLIKRTSFTLLSCWYFFSRRFRGFFFWCLGTGFRSFFFTTTRSFLRWRRSFRFTIWWGSFYCWRRMVILLFLRRLLLSCLSFSCRFCYSSWVVLSIIMWIRFTLFLPFLGRCWCSDFS